MAPKEKNILLLIADDLGKNLGCYGAKVKTPHLDKLAADGVKFDKAFASTASCSCSRSVIYTGLHAHTNGLYGLNHTFHHFMTFDHVETMPWLFNEAGYLTGIVNKIHVGPDAIYNWEVRDAAPSHAGSRDNKWIAERSAEFFKRANDDDKPFCLTIGYTDPHRDGTRGGFGNDETYPGYKAVKYDPKDVEVPYYLNDLPLVRNELAQYYESISRMDEGVGMVLDELAKSGHADDTLVMFVSDNGPPFLNSKTTLYDAGVCLPMIVRAPGAPEGSVNDAIVSYVDILPTFLDWAGVKHPAHRDGAPKRHGRSILPVLDAKEMPKDWNEVYGSHTFHEVTNYYPTRFVRTPKYKYHRNICWQLDFPFSVDIFASKSWDAIRNQPKVDVGNGKKDLVFGKRTLTQYLRRGPEELFDLENDPEEVVNLAQDPKYADVVKELRDKVEAWQRESEDPWLFRDGVSVMSMMQYLGEDGYQLQERFDFELENPGTGDLACKA